MTYGVFIHRSDSIYDDTPSERYQFPAQYLGRAQQCVGDWIVYYEPKKVDETRGYFAIAKVQAIIPDSNLNGMYVALIEPGSYLDFARPVPFAGIEGPIESGLLNEHGRLSGRAQSAVRPISPQDFNRIIELGLHEGFETLPRVDDSNPCVSFQEEQTPFEFDVVRDRIIQLTSRAVRERIFRRVVIDAYAQRCAVTGLRLINGGGRAEVEAAHIKPVEKGGPDIVTNGIALSGTAHWMFDRGLVSFGDDMQMLISRHVNDRDAVAGLLNKTGFALLPRRPMDRPHPHFLEWHRANCFKH